MFIEVKDEDQIKEVVRLAREIWLDYYVSIVTKEQVEYMLDKYQSEIAIYDQIYNQGYSYFLFVYNNESAGYLAFQQRGNELFLSKVYVRKSYRGRGFGRKLIEFSKEFAQNYGLSKLSLTCNKYNFRSLAVYEKCGFQKAKSVVIDIGSGYVMDDYVMELIS